MFAIALRGARAVAAPGPARRNSSTAALTARPGPVRLPLAQRAAKVARRGAASTTMAASFFDFSGTSPAESESKPGVAVPLSKYTGKVVLAVNTATL